MSFCVVTVTPFIIIIIIINIAVYDRRVCIIITLRTTTTRILREQIERIE